MKDVIIEALKNVSKDLINTADNLGITNISQLKNNYNINVYPRTNNYTNQSNNINTKVYPQTRSNNQQSNNIPTSVIDSYNANTNNYNENVDNINTDDSKTSSINNDYNTKMQTTSSSPQSVIDSIAEVLTPVKLQQAIILSEIVGKPRSKTRKKRRF